jgi:hypothetical protein
MAACTQAQSLLFFAVAFVRTPPKSAAMRIGSPGSRSIHIAYLAPRDHISMSLNVIAPEAWV